MSTEQVFTKSELRALGFTVKQIKSLTPTGKVVTTKVGRPKFTYSAEQVASLTAAAQEPVAQAA